MNAINDLYIQYKQHIDEVEYLPSMPRNHDLFVDFRNKTNGVLSNADWSLLTEFLNEYEKNWFVVYVLNVLNQLSDKFTNSLLNNVIASFYSLDETKLYFQNLHRIKGFLFIEKKLQDIYSSLQVPRTKHQVHKCFYLNTCQIIPRWKVDNKLEECDKTIFQWNNGGYRATLEMFNYSKDYELLLASEKALKNRFLLLIEDLTNCNFPIQEEKFLVNLIPENLSFDDNMEQKKYLSGIEKIKTLENIWKA